MIIKKIHTLNENDFSELLAFSLQEEYRFVQRLIEEFKNGTNRFDKVGEVLFVVEHDKKIVGVGGVNIDPYTSDINIGRIRHVYVLPAYRQKGVGKELLRVFNRGSSEAI